MKIPLHGSYNTVGKASAKVETISNTSQSVTQNAAAYLNTAYIFCNSIYGQSSLIYTYPWILSFEKPL